MKKNKISMYLIILLLLFFILLIGVVILKNKKYKKENYYNAEEYIPLEEISEEQLRYTNIELYFYNKEAEKITLENRQIDAKILLDNPAKKLIQFLIEGPEDNNLDRLIPESTKIIDSNIDRGILTINFSEDFIQEKGLEKETLIMDSIVKTIGQLTEVNYIKILINGEENQSFMDNAIKFEKLFEIK